MAVVWRSLMVYLTAALPMIEGKGAVLLGQIMGMPARWSYMLSVAGSYTPVPFLLYGGWDIPLFGTDKIPATFRRYVERYGCWTLLVMISIPFTGFGCWLSAIAARALQMDKNKSALAIFVGNAIAILLMTGCLSGLFIALRSLLHLG